MMHLRSNNANSGAVRCSILLVALFALVHDTAIAARTVVLKSPDQQLSVTVRADDSGAVRYAVSYRDHAVIADSRLGLVLKQDAPIGADCRITATHRSSHHGDWKPVHGERDRIPDNYNAVAIDLTANRAPARRWTLKVRAYNEGVAWCYSIPKQESLANLTITREDTEFHFHGDHPAWAVYTAQGRYAQVPLSNIKPGCERPLTVRVAKDVYVALCEARLVDSARMKLAPRAGRAHTLVSQLSGVVVATTPWTSPWRVVLVADSPGRLLEQNYLLRNLNAPCALDDPSWIQPGKVIREVTLTTRGGKACVDFAAAHNLQFVEFDAGWYGHEYSGAADATTVTVDPKRSPGPLDLHEVIRYAKDHDIGIILYVNRRALERQLDEILPLFQRWGVRGVKYGFVQVGSQQSTCWLHAAVRKAAACHLMVDIHDEYRPTGYSRTYPNLMTQEGIAGDETSPTNDQTLMILFTRMLAGAADNTFCYYDARVDKNASHAYQLAKAVCLYSPWQFLYWYDRPSASPGDKGGAGNSAHLIGAEPELEFFDHLPTVWDETRVLQGVIGRYAVVARRRGRDWFIGCMNAVAPRTFTIPLDFLAPSATYIAHVYSDDPAVATRTHVRVTRRSVTAATPLSVQLMAHGGRAFWIERMAITRKEKRPLGQDHHESVRVWKPKKERIDLTPRSIIQLSNATSEW